ncbi:MAG: GGDEF domain-containing protein [Hydrogenophilales bacterium]|nr:GGDEF domain-containing protein [Hydrogenophilales bacterium]
MKPSLARYFLIAFLAALTLIASAGLMLYHGTTDAERHSRDRAPIYAPQLLANQIAESTRQWARATKAIAQSPLALRILKSADASERRELMATLASLQPELGEIQLITSEQAKGQTPIPSALGAQQKHMIEKARTASNQGAALRAETLSLTLSEPVRDADGGIAGFVLVVRNLAEVRALFATTPLIDGYAELQQVNGVSDTLLKRGNEQLKFSGSPLAITLEGTPWRLVMWRKPVLTGLAADLHRAYLGVGGALIVLLALCLWLAYRLANRMLQDDLTIFTKLFSDVTHERLRKRYPIELRELQNGYQVMYQLAKMIVNKHQRVVSSAGIDHLSQVSNRRSFESKQHEVFARVNEGWAHSLLILDIDDFKRVNDTYGHDAGDQLIVQFGKLLKEHLRSSDFVARLGGDEFCVIFPNTPLKKAEELAQRLRANMPSRLELQPNVLHHLSWSGGLSEYSRQDISENAALARADQALLDAKRAGRSRTEVKAA